MMKNLLAMQETWVWSLGQEDPLEKEMATHSRILAWRIPWTEAPGGLQSKGSQRVGHDWVTKHAKFQIGIEYGGKQIGHVRLEASEAIHTVVQLPSRVWHLDPGSKQRHSVSTTPRSPVAPPILGIPLLGVWWEMGCLSPQVDHGHLGRHLSKWGAEYIPEGISCRLKKASYLQNRYNLYNRKMKVEYNVKAEMSYPY